MLIFVFCIVGIFTILFIHIPTGFLLADYESNLGVDQEMVNYFSINNITMYEMGEDFNLTYPGTEKFDLHDGSQLDYWWNDDQFNIYSMDKVIEVRHLTDNIFGYWYGWHALDFDVEGAINDGMLTWYLVNERYDADLNGSLFNAECDHLTLNLVVRPTMDYSTLEESWNNDVVRITTSYQINFSATNINAFSILGKLITFQSPNLGIGGDLGTMLNAIIAVPFWIMIAIMIIILIQSVIPLIRGIPD